MATKEPIRLRRRVTPTGNVSLYLDIYIGGRRSYEYLRMYLIPERTREDKEKNRQTLALAEAVRAKRIVELQNGQFGFHDRSKGDINFYTYCEDLYRSRYGEEERGSIGTWRSCLKHLESFDGRLRQRTFKEVDANYVWRFKEYLERDARAWVVCGRGRDKTRRLSRNTRMGYFNKLRACINQALRDGIITVNPLRGIEPFTGEETERMYLTVEEVQRLASTPCDCEGVREAFLFSCLTGLRRSDIERLTWADVHTQGAYTRIIFRQRKTGGQEYLDITAEAVELMGLRGRPDEPVFRYLLTPSATNECLKRWCLRAGIDKAITFHCGRHTFATMMLDLGVDIYTVSKLLGHRKLSTTQIYTKVLDKSKQAAVSMIPSVLNTDKAK